MEAYLATHDVASTAELDGLMKAPENALMAIASDGHMAGLTRARAVAALRLVPSLGVQAFLLKLVQSNAKATDATERLIVRRAAVVLGWMAGAGSAEKLALLFDNDDAEVRLDAAIGIGLTRAETAATLLHRQLAVESVAKVRDQIERQLRALGAAPVEPEASKPPKKVEPMRAGW
jgi:HEAT repeat protein